METSDALKINVRQPKMIENCVCRADVNDGKHNQFLVSLLGTRFVFRSWQFGYSDCNKKNPSWIMCNRRDSFDRHQTE